MKLSALASLIIMLLTVTCFTFCSGPAVSVNPNIRLNINKLEAEEAEPEMVSMISEILFQNLSELKGKDKILLREKNGIDKSTNRQLMGRAVKLGSKYIITIKVAEGESGALLYTKSISASKNEIIEKLKNISAEISSDKKIWQPL